MSNHPPCPHTPPKAGQICITALLLPTVPFLMQRLLQSLGHPCFPSLSLFHTPLETRKRGELQAASSAWAHPQLAWCQCFLSHPLLLPCSFPTVNFLLSLLQAFGNHNLARPPGFPSWEEMHHSESITGLPVLGEVFMCFLCPFSSEFPWLSSAQGHGPAASKSSVLVPNTVTLLALPFSR